MKRAQKITSRERDLLAIWRGEGISLREMGRRLGRNVSSVSRELDRNKSGAHYVALAAQTRASKRKSEAGKRHPLHDENTYGYVVQKLGWGWSPEQIAGRLARDQGKRIISPESIYQFIYKEENKEEKLWEYLPRKYKRRRKKHGRKSQRGQIPDRTSIHERPEEVEAREVFGHWEGDSVEGKGHKGGVHTQVERKTRLYLAVKIEDLTDEETQRAQQKIFALLPKQARKSTTVDNGKEFTRHKEFELPVYFADPYSSWQRGTNENSNGLLRRYYPKGTDFTKVSQEEINDIVQEINHRPRKCLDYATPSEIFWKELLASVAIPI